FFSSRRRHTRSKRDWSSDVCSSDLNQGLDRLQTRCCGMKNSRFKDIVIASEVLQDGVFDLIEAGKVKFAYATAFSLSEERVATRSEERRVGKECRDGW